MKDYEDFRLHHGQIKKKKMMAHPRSNMRQLKAQYWMPAKVKGKKRKGLGFIHPGPHRDKKLLIAFSRTQDF